MSDTDHPAQRRFKSNTPKDSPQLPLANPPPPPKKTDSSLAYCPIVWANVAVRHAQTKQAFSTKEPQYLAYTFSFSLKKNPATHDFIIASAY